MSCHNFSHLEILLLHMIFFRYVTQRSLDNQDSTVVWHKQEKFVVVLL